MLRVFLFLTCLCLAAIFQPTNSYAQSNEMIKKCHVAKKILLEGSRENLPEGVYCIGVFGAYLEVDAIRGQAAPYCFPGPPNFGQIIAVWLKFMDQFPEHMDKPPYMSYSVAMAVNFPCEKENKEKN